MTYSEVEAYINAIPKFTSKNKPDHTRHFMELMGNPQEKFRVIHVAGSNGKGSVCAMIHSVLRQRGRHCGLFISPHLVSLTERFMIDGENCPEELFLEANEIVQKAVSDLEKTGLAHPTFFEYLYGLGMVIFARAGVEVAVVETGLGGRLDATNVIKKPELTVITSISLEHTEILGDTIEEIAGEKAGIIKEKVPVVYDSKNPLAAQVIENAAERSQAASYPVKPDKYGMEKLSEEGVNFWYEGNNGKEYYQVPFPAQYQVENGAIAVAACHVLQETEGLSQEEIKKGLKEVRWPGRMEQMLPGVFLDGAHNPDGIKEFINTVQKIGGNDPILIFAMVKDKDYHQAVTEIQNISWGKILVTQIQGDRKLMADELGQLFGNQDRVEVCQNSREALKKALEERKNQNIFIAGSLYLIGEVKQIWEEIKDD